MLLSVDCHFYVIHVDNNNKYKAVYYSIGGTDFLPGTFVGIGGTGTPTTPFPSTHFTSYYPTSAYPIKTEPVTPLKQIPSSLDDKVATKPSEVI